MSRVNYIRLPSCLRVWAFYVASAFFLSALLFASRVQAADETQVEATTDLRILVDVSGSMKKNDPNNLRRDALRLLIGMLPETSRVGIWSFGQYVNMQVKPGFATKAWKNNARKEANKIRSLGLYTNIQDTLTKSSWDWRRPDPKWDRHMILLTDGMVDISKDPKKNKKSRQKILGSIVSDLKAANVKIHTIALSKQADHELLKTLSKKTNGWYESVESADMLQRLFLRLFEKTTKMDSLPLEDNLFDVDDSISDMTLLVFRSGSGKPTKVLAPDHSVFEYEKPSKGVEWFQDKNFDIITVHKPMVGKWKIDADIDKDNRVKIISNLKLSVAPLPLDIVENESVKLKASIVTKDGLLDDKEMLSLIKVSANTTGYKGNEVTQEVPASSKTGKYETILEGVDEKGTVQIVIKVDSPTFKRESRHEIKVHENPVKLTLKATSNGLVISVKENPLLIQTGTLQLALRIDGNKGAYYVTKYGAHRWQATLDNSFSGKAITIDATANRIGNIPFRSKLHGRLPEAVKPMKDPLTVWVEEIESGLVIKAMLEENIIQTGTLQLGYYAEENKETPITITQKTDKVWQQLLLPEYTGKTLIVSASAYQLDGKPFNKEYKVVVPELKVKDVASEEPNVEEHAGNNDEPESEDEHDKESGHEKEEEHAPEETSVVVVITLLIIANIIIFGGAYFGYRYWKKKNKPIEDDLDDESDPVEAVDTVPDTVDAIPDVKENIDDEPPPETEKPVEVDEDFSAQRKEPPLPEDVDLDIDEASGAEDDAELIEKSSADDLPEFDVDMESDISDESTSEKEK